ncbi:hypothetical protein BJX64DRAFT_255850 [Aspergillus heterothallicus]
MDGSGLTNGYSGQAYSLAIDIDPPSSVRPGVAFTLPVVLAVRPGQAASNHTLVAYVSLLDETGTSSSTRISGPLTLNVRSQAGNSASAYASFRSLTIASPGRYRLRITLAVSTYSETRTVRSVNSRVIDVQAGAPLSQRPTAVQISRLQRLVPENIGISLGDIATWQQL